jgi:hypothetical protein
VHVRVLATVGLAGVMLALARVGGVLEMVTVLLAWDVVSVPSLAVTVQITSSSRSQ